MSGMRLNQFIAHAGVCSRRKAEKLIVKGKIRVNGQLVTDLHCRVLPSDLVMYEGRVLVAQKKIYLLLNKPLHTITTLRDPERRRTVMDLVPDFDGLRLYPVGRLDYKTTGLLLLTNDGVWAQVLAHPSKKIRKVYEVVLTKKLAPKHCAQLENGILLADGLARVDRLVAVDKTYKRWHITLHSGKNRMIRRLFQAVGYTIGHLDRIAYGNLTKQGVAVGKWRFLTSMEVKGLATQAKV